MVINKSIDFWVIMSGSVLLVIFLAFLLYRRIRYGDNKQVVNATEGRRNTGFNIPIFLSLLVIAIIVWILVPSFFDNGRTRESFNGKCDVCGIGGDMYQLDESQYSGQKLVHLSIREYCDQHWPMWAFLHPVKASYLMFKSVVKPRTPNPIILEFVLWTVTSWFLAFSYIGIAVVVSRKSYSRGARLLSAFFGLALLFGPALICILT